MGGGGRGSKGRGKQGGRGKPSGPKSSYDVFNVCFVLGGPGSGKGTQCGLAVAEIKRADGWHHISAGDCLREAKADASHPKAELINGLMQEGKLIPSDITVGLMLEKMEKIAVEVDAKAQEKKY